MRKEERLLKEIQKQLHVRGCFQDRAERALWRLYMVLREIAIGNEHVKEKKDER